VHAEALKGLIYRSYKPAETYHPVVLVPALGGHAHERTDSHFEEGANSWVPLKVPRASLDSGRFVQAVQEVVEFDGYPAADGSLTFLVVAAATAVDSLTFE